MIYIYVWLGCSVLGSFVVGWVVGRYGHYDKPAQDPNKLIAVALSRTNRMEIQ